MIFTKKMLIFRYRLRIETSLPLSLPSIPSFNPFLQSLTLIIPISTILINPKLNISCFASFFYIRIDYEASDIYFWIASIYLNVYN